MIGSQGIQYNSHRYSRVYVSDFVRTIRRELRAPEVAAIFDNQTKKWLLIEWLDHEYGRMQELFVLGKRPEGTRLMIRILEGMIRGTDQHNSIRSENKRILQGFERECERQDAEAGMDHADAYSSWMRRPGKCNSNKVVVPG